MIKKITAAVFAAVCLSSVCFSGCKNSQESAQSSAPSQTESVVSTVSDTESNTESSQADVQESKTESKQESKIDPEQEKINTAIKEINILNEYKRNIPEERDIDFVRYDLDGTVEPDRERYNKGKVCFVDAVIRDINEDGHYEMVVKYDCRSLSYIAMQGRNEDVYQPTSYIYDIVSVVNDKAVETEHYINEDGWLDCGPQG